jgi:hypothetical protein
MLVGSGYRLMYVESSGNRSRNSRNKIHSCADNGFERVAVFLYDRRAFSHYKKGRGTGAEVVGYGGCPEGGGDKEAVTGNVS